MAVGCTAAPARLIVLDAVVLASPNPGSKNAPITPTIVLAKEVIVKPRFHLDEDSPFFFLNASFSATPAL